MKDKVNKKVTRYEDPVIPKEQEKNYKFRKLDNNTEYTVITNKEEVDRIKSIIEKEEKEFFDNLDENFNRVISYLIENEYKRPYLIELIKLLFKTKKLEDFRYFDQFISEHSERIK